MLHLRAGIWGQAITDANGRVVLLQKREKVGSRFWVEYSGRGSGRDGRRRARRSRKLPQVSMRAQAWFYSCSVVVFQKFPNPNTRCPRTANRIAETLETLEANLFPSSPEKQPRLVCSSSILHAVECCVSRYLHVKFFLDFIFLSSEFAHPFSPTEI